MTIREFLSYLSYSQEITIWHKQHALASLERYTTDIAGEAYIEDYILNSKITSIGANADGILVIYCIG